MFRFILLVAATAYLAEAKMNVKCPWVMGKSPFDEFKFQGDWYLIAGLPFFEEKLQKCGKFTYKPMKPEKEGGISYKLMYDGMNPATNEPYALEAVSVPFFGKGDHFANSMGVWKKSGSNDWTSVFKQSIVATDYENYAVFMACSPMYDDKTSTFTKKMLAGVWSRKRTLGQETLDVLKNVLTSYDIKLSDLQTAEQTNCP